MAKLLRVFISLLRFKIKVVYNQKKSSYEEGWRYKQHCFEYIKENTMYYRWILLGGKLFDCMKFWNKLQTLPELAVCEVSAK